MAQQSSIKKLPKVLLWHHHIPSLYEHDVASRVIPTINLAALFEADSPPGHALATTDRAVFEAATTLGFMAITGLPHGADIDASAKQTLTTLFNLTAE